MNMRTVRVGAAALVLSASMAPAALITGVSIHEVSSEYTSYGWDLRAIHLVDDSGLSGSPPVHAQTVFPGGESWQTITSSSTGVVAFDFGSPYEIASLQIWNLNFYAPYNGRGARLVRIETSMDAGTWTEVEPQVEFPMATGLAGDPGFPLDAAGWGTARYVRFHVLSNWAGFDHAGHVGLSEVRFFAADAPPPAAAVPEPASAGLLALAALGLLRRQLRR